MKVEAGLDRFYLRASIGYRQCFACGTLPSNADASEGCPFAGYRIEVFDELPSDRWVVAVFGRVGDDVVACTDPACRFALREEIKVRLVAQATGGDVL